eukprot:g5566.t1
MTKRKPAAKMRRQTAALAHDMRNRTATGAGKMKMASKTSKQAVAKSKVDAMKSAKVALSAGTKVSAAAAAKAVTRTKSTKKKTSSSPAACPAPKPRLPDCGWGGFYAGAANNALYQNYHDTEWGRPRRNGKDDDLFLFEMLVLELSQAGLSWATILKKREAYRGARLTDLHYLLQQSQSQSSNCDFKPDAKKAALLVQRFLDQGEGGIVRNVKKIEAAVHNAWAFAKIQAEHGSFCDFIWELVVGSVEKHADAPAKMKKPGESMKGKDWRQPVVNSWSSLKEIPAKTVLSDKVKNALVKDYGMKFLGSTTVYAFLQSCGFVNDHLKTCWCWKECL